MLLTQSSHRDYTSQIYISDASKLAFPNDLVNARSKQCVAEDNIYEILSKNDDTNSKSTRKDGL